MPHLIVKLYPGRTEEQKQALADALTKAVTSTLHNSEDAVSVAMVEVPRERWVDDVYTPDILGNPEQIYKKPGYDPTKKQT